MQPIPVGGASLLVAYRLRGKRVLIVGGGDVASGRLEHVIAADAFITLIAPSDGLHPRTRFLIQNSDRITYHDRVFGGYEDLAGVDMALTAIDDVNRSREICNMCRELKIPVNVADIPPSCDFYFGSQIRRGSLQVVISTGGKGPKLANMIRRRLEESLPEGVEEAIENVGKLRTKLRKRAPGVGGKISSRRMKWMSSVCETWDLQNLAKLDEDAIDALLNDGWDKDASIPTPSTVLGIAEQPRPPPALVPAVAGFIAGIALTSAFFLLRRR